MKNGFGTDVSDGGKCQEEINKPLQIDVKKTYRCCAQVTKKEDGTTKDQRKTFVSENN